MGILSLNPYSTCKAGRKERPRMTRMTRITGQNQDADVFILLAVSAQIGEISGSSSWPLPLEPVEQCEIGRWTLRSSPRFFSEFRRLRSIRRSHLQTEPAFGIDPV